MPQASDEDRNEMIRRFGDISDSGPTQYLQDNGWTLHDDWTWSHPNYSRACYNAIPQTEWVCIIFLVEEWDFGGLKK